MTDHPNAIKLDPGAALTDESVEVARIWTPGCAAVASAMADGTSTVAW